MIDPLLIRYKVIYYNSTSFNKIFGLLNKIINTVSHLNRRIKNK